MKPLNLFLALPLLAFATSSSAQDRPRLGGIENAITVTVRINGDCDMCKTRIDKVGSVKGEAAVDWDTDAKTASVTYDSTRTDLDAILQRVADAGYDTERFRATDPAYRALPGCCQYDRGVSPEPSAR
ncbi:MAG: heavy-metal-associated domain-containing protein [Flavobacteriales bacterium]|nr:heavy-metal-associated domain-containing protein [Flavobacteriales bacterium]